MEKSNISNSQETIQNIDSKNIFIHVIKPEFIPVGMEFVLASNIDALQINYYEEIFVADLFDYMEYHEFTAILDLLLNKLSNNGSITIQATDLYQLSSAITFNDIDLETAKLVIYNNKKTMYNLKEIETELTNRYLEIIDMKYINIFEYFIKAHKK
jgi:hypothetical protein